MLLALRFTIDILIHLQSRGFGSRSPHGHGWNTNHRGMWRHIIEDHAAGSNLGAVTYPDIAKYFCTGTDENAVANLGMAIAGFIAGTSQGNFMQHRDIIADKRGFANDQTGSVINKNSFAYLGGRVNIYRKYFRDAVLII